MDVILTTIIKRPYVFLFLIGFLYLGIRHMGLARTFVWLLTGYVIAFISEYSSIHNGFPYGEYHYIYENLQGELILAGVPVWDSLSYAFMSYAGYGAARFALIKTPFTLSQSKGENLMVRQAHHERLKIWLLGALLTMILDVITDPVAKLGKDWFLGDIYYYAHKGWYFNVPWTNFAGWFAVSAAIIGVNLLIFRSSFLSPCGVLSLSKGEEGSLSAGGLAEGEGEQVTCHPRAVPAGRQEGGDPGHSTSLDSGFRRNDKAFHFLFYFSICLFSTAIAFAIGAHLLGTVNLLITLALFIFVKFLNSRS